MTVLRSCGLELRLRTLFRPKTLSKLVIAFKNVISEHRNGYRIMKDAEQKLLNCPPEKRDGTLDLKTVNEFRFKMEKEIRDVCQEMLYLISEHIIVTCSTPEAKVFYYKLRADYYRYLAEISPSAEYKEQSLDSVLKTFIQTHQLESKV